VWHSGSQVRKGNTHIKNIRNSEAGTGSSKVAKVGELDESVINSACNEISDYMCFIENMNKEIGGSNSEQSL
jgi:hypothetical protein